MTSPLLLQQVQELEKDFNSLTSTVQKARPLPLKYLEVIDDQIKNPHLTQTELAQRHGFSRSWLSAQMNSDSYKSQLAKRRNELLGIQGRRELQERTQQLAFQSIEVLSEKLQQESTADLALQALGVALSTRANHNLK